MVKNTAYNPMRGMEEVEEECRVEVIRKSSGTGRRRGEVQAEEEEEEKKVEFNVVVAEKEHKMETKVGGERGR